MTDENKDSRLSSHTRALVGMHKVATQEARDAIDTDRRIELRRAQGDFIDSWIARLRDKR